MEWTNGRSLKSYKDTTKNQEINYKYNKDGIREEKSINGEVTKYYLENNRIIYEQRGNDTIYYLYDLTGLIGLKYNDNIYYYLKNLQGDIIGILDQDYKKIVTYEYDSWGKLLSIKDKNENEITDKNHIGIINPFRYREYYYDEETGLYYLNSRYYHPTWDRFLNADEILGVNQDIFSYNLYIYVSNNPIIQYDPIGYGLLKGIKSFFNTVGKQFYGFLNNTVGRIISLNVVKSQSQKLISNTGFPVIETSVGVSTKTSQTVFGKSDSLIKINVGSSNGMEVSGAGSVSLDIDGDSFNFNTELSGFRETTSNFSLGFDGKIYVEASRCVKLDDSTSISTYGRINVDNTVTRFCSSCSNSRGRLCSFKKCINRNGGSNKYGCCNFNKVMK